MNSAISICIDKLNSIFISTEEALSEWTETKNLQFPELMRMLSEKLTLDEKQLREYDPLVRFYVRNHPEWYVTRGAKGGIMRVSERQKKENAKAAKDAVKAALKANIEAIKSQKENSTEKSPVEDTIEE